MDKWNSTKQLGTIDSQQEYIKAIVIAYNQALHCSYITKTE